MTTTTTLPRSEALVCCLCCLRMASSGDPNLDLMITSAMMRGIRAMMLEVILCAISPSLHRTLPGIIFTRTHVRAYVECGE